MLVSPEASYFKDSDLLVAADCVKKYNPCEYGSPLLFWAAKDRRGSCNEIGKGTAHKADRDNDKGRETIRISLLDLSSLM
jgi:hypothetical protein